MKKTYFITLLLCMIFVLPGYVHAFDIDMMVNVGEEIVLPETVKYNNSDYKVTWDKKSVNTDTPGVIYVEGECAGLGEKAELYILVKNKNISISDIKKEINYTEKTGKFTTEIVGNNNITTIEIYKQNSDAAEIVKDTAVYTEAKEAANGKAEFNVSLAKLDKGRYLAVVSSGDVSVSSDFVWLDPDGFMQEVLNMTEDEKLGENMSDLYDEYSQIIEAELKASFEALEEDERELILKNLYAATKNMSDVTFGKIVKELDKQTAFLIFLDSDDMTAFFVQKEPPYCEILGLDTSEESYYNKLLDKAFVNTYIESSLPANVKGLEKAFYESVALASLNQAERGDVYNILNELNIVNEIQIIDIKDELSRLNSSEFTETEKNKIWSKMALKSDYLTMQDIKKKLNEEIDIVLSSREDKKGSSGNGSSSFASDSSGNYSSGYKTPVILPAESETNTSDIFTDLGEAEWARKYIIKLYERGIVEGNDGKFRPNNAVTRAEFSAMLARSMQLELVSETEKSFADVNENAWYADYVNTLWRYGIIQGVDELYFNPDGYLTREDMCVLIYRALKYMDKIVSVTETDDFSDNNQISDYAKEAVKYLQSTNAVDGMGNNLFMPKTICSRAMICKVICGTMN